MLACWHRWLGSVNPAQALQQSISEGNNLWICNCWDAMLRCCKRAFFIPSSYELWSIFFLNKTAILREKKKSFANLSPAFRGAFLSSDLSQKHGLSFAKLSPAFRGAFLSQSFANHFWSTSMVILYQILYKGLFIPSSYAKTWQGAPHLTPCAWYGWPRTLCSQGYLFRPLAESKVDRNLSCLSFLGFHVYRQRAI